MIDVEKTLTDLIKPLCNDPSGVTVKQMTSLQDNEVLLYVYAPEDDIARLIGRKGIMANAIRTMLQVAGKIEHQKITIKFETIETL